MKMSEKARVLYHSSVIGPYPGLFIRPNLFPVTLCMQSAYTD
ncbi:hypothetical protein Poly41_18310 [Novipirellula artificiosorum]|uniref:Uncharacterized protein n=1 Tax=Novipirellula artificiosorum TaxID=2528016 RepID=A0A5C6E0X7_9BACT|nr:hypothetical protein Poly41_18310 [Novipirellula artificiosorum]